MPRHYYAMFTDTRHEIAIFDSERQRNDWVNYEDPYSKAVPGHYDGKRIAIPRFYAEYIVGRNALRSREDTADFYYEKDCHNDEITWVIDAHGRRPTMAELIAAITPPWEKAVVM